jgi:hypothetical protein
MASSMPRLPLKDRSAPYLIVGLKNHHMAWLVP